MPNTLKLFCLKDILGSSSLGRVVRDPGRQPPSVRCFATDVADMFERTHGVLGLQCVNFPRFPDVLWPMLMNHFLRSCSLRLSGVVLLMVTLAACSFHSLRESRPDSALPKYGYKSLDHFPFREAWYGIYYEDVKIGYSHFKIDRGEKDFVIAFDSVVRLKIGRETKEIDLKESVHVKPDLALVSFESMVVMHNKKMEMRGVVKDSRLEVQLAVAEEVIRREYDFPGTLYHSSALSLMPALRGIRDGQTYTFLTFNAEKQEVQKVEQTISSVKEAPGPKNSVWKVRTVSGKSIIHSWLNKEGLPIIDKGSSEPIITFLEDETSAKNFLKRQREGLLRHFPDVLAESR